MESQLVLPLTGSIMGEYSGQLERIISYSYGTYASPMRDSSNHPSRSDCSQKKAHIQILEAKRKSPKSQTRTQTDTAQFRYLFAGHHAGVFQHRKKTIAHTCLFYVTAFLERSGCGSLIISV